MIKSVIIITILAATMTACDSPEYQLDQSKREELFFRCLEKLPKGPDTAMSNDWAEVVSECGSEAYYMAQKCIRNCI